MAFLILYTIAMNDFVLKLLHLKSAMDYIPIGMVQLIGIQVSYEPVYP